LFWWKTQFWLCINGLKLCMMLFIVYLPFSLFPSLPEIMFILHKSIVQIFYLRCVHKVLCLTSYASRCMWGIVLIFWCMKKFWRWLIKCRLNEDHSKNSCFNFTWIFCLDHELLISGILLLMVIKIIEQNYESMNSYQDDVKKFAFGFQVLTLYIWAASLWFCLLTNHQNYGTTRGWECIMWTK
jgi:hypothetical protein